MPIETVREYLEMCNETRQDMPASDLTTHDEWVTGFRKTLVETYELDVRDPRIVAAVAAGVVEGMAAALEQGSVSRGALACGWALYDLALPHLTAAAA